MKVITMKKVTEDLERLVVVTEKEFQALNEMYKEVVKSELHRDGSYLVINGWRMGRIFVTTRKKK